MRNLFHVKLLQILYLQIHLPFVAFLQTKYSLVKKASEIFAFLGDTEVTFTMNGFNRTVAINGINDLRIFIQDGRAMYNGVPLAFSTTDNCPIAIDGDCQDGDNFVGTNDVRELRDRKA